jgi:ATP-binding cassette subfamily B multidrug efflux pump
VDALRADGAGTPLGRDVALIALLAVGSGLARLGSRFAIVGAAQHVEADLRERLYASLQRLPPAFYARHATGDLMARATSDVSTLRMLCGFGGLSVLSTTFAFVGAIAAMLAVDAWLTMLAMAPYPALVLLARRFNAALHERTLAAQEQLGTLSGRVQEYLAGMPVVRAYTMERHAAADFGAANAEYLRRSVALARVQARFTPLMGLVAGIGTLVVLWAGGIAVASGRLSLGALVAFNGYLAYLAWPTIALGLTLSILRRGLTSMGRLLEIVEAAAPEAASPAPEAASTPAVSADGAAARLPAVAAIAFRRLSFAYEGRPPVLEDVSFEVGVGETVAVVGPTGSGKSTLGLLLARLWEPPPDTVFVGGRDVRALPPAALRAALGWVPQEAFLFSRSITDNVALGRASVTPAAARAAAEAAGVASEVDALPRGWDTVVGERGLTVSGGQRQRLALARALAGGPALLVLDDVFASVDPAKEEEILAGLRRHAPGRTVLLITHRLRAARAADRIVVLVAGRVVETGAHEALLGAGGPYARLWRTQQLEEEIARA